MTARLGDERALALARGGDEQAFEALTGRYRRELQVHCYRLLGSVQDAEDMVQETLLAAWRGLDGFEGRSSLRAWLYRIATNACLGVLRRARPERSLSREPPAEMPSPTRVPEPVWLEPYPDEQLPDPAAGPAARYDARESIQLAFVTALQRLPARQRAALVLRDVLGFQAAEAATMLGASEASVNSALQRARLRIDELAPARLRERAPLPGSAEERRAVGRFADAFERGDVDALVALLTDDALLTMPPMPLEYEGRRAIHTFFSTVPAGGRLERFRLVPTRANGQPAFGCYLRDADGARMHAYGLLVLTIEGGAVRAITGFADTALFARFGLPRTLRG